jgi:VWFA-related protein
VAPARVGLLIGMFWFAAAGAQAQQSASAAPAPAAATPADSSGQVPTIRVTSRIVMLDVVVTDGQGHSVKGLKPSDFALSEDGAPQKLDSFSEVDAAPAAPQDRSAAEPTLPPDTFAVTPPVTGNGAMTVIVLANIAWEHVSFTHDQLKEFLATSALQMPIAIFRIDCIGLHLVQGFSADRKMLLEAANSKRIMPSWPPPDCQRYVSAIGSPAQRLAGFLAGVPGRINLVWFGESQPPDLTYDGLFPDVSGGLPPDLGAVMQSAGDGPNVHRLSRIALYPIVASGLGAPSACLSQSCVEIYAKKISGGMASCQELMEMATSAGGKAFCNTNGFKEALAEVVDTGSHYYTLSYRPTNGNWNGAYRNIKVTVPSLQQESAADQFVDWFTKVPASLYPKVVYRDGYYARDAPGQPQHAADSTQHTADSEPPPSDAATPQRRLISISPRGVPTGGDRNAARLEAAMSFGKPTPVGVHFTVVVTPAPQVEKTKASEPLPPENFLTGPFAGSAYRNYKIHYWVDPQDMHFARTASGTYRDDFQFVAVIYRDDGVAANSIASPSHIEVTEDDRELLMSSGVTFDQTIAIPVEGSFFLRAGVLEAESNQMGALEVSAEWVTPATAQTAAAAQTP